MTAADALVRSEPPADEYLLASVNNSATPAAWRGLVAITAVLIAAGLLFTRLGHYALWDDEANTALFGLSVWQTGDTYAKLDHNLIAYEGGRELQDLRNRYLPPLQYFLVSPFVGIGDRDSFWPRFPFALCGLGTIALTLLVARRHVPSDYGFVLICLGMLLSTAMLLYFRQCRYFAPTTLLGCAAIVVYLTCARTVIWMLAGGVLLLLLLASNYVFFAITAAVLAIDYAIWGRHRQPIPVRGWLLLLVPLVVGGLPLVLVFNPIGVEIYEGKPNPWYARPLLVWWAVRDLNRSEMLSSTALVAAMVLAVVRPHAVWLRRTTVAAVVAIVVAAMAGPHHILWFDAFHVRYLAAAMPLFVALTVLVIWHLTRRRAAWVGVVVGLIAFGTNVLNFGTYTIAYARDSSAVVRATFVSFVRELASPPADPYRAASDWLRANAKPGDTVAAYPPYTLYPLMYHAPDPLYAWQLDNASDPQFSGLPRAHFRGAELPKILLLFAAPAAQRQWAAGLRGPAGERYVERETLPVYGREVFRPEIWLRSFQSPAMGASQSSGVVVLELSRTAGASVSEDAAK